MNDDAELFTIGQLARRTGVPVRTIRFWSDAGVLPAAQRSPGGYRLYDAEAVARLDLVRTLRELGFELDAVRQILRKQASVADVATAHVRALDAEIRILQLRRAVLRVVAKRDVQTKEMTLMHRLARLSAQERQQIIDAFVAEVFEGVDPETPGARIAQAMRQLPAELPGDPTPEQVDAWVELAELVSDSDFRVRARQMAVAGAQAPAPETQAGTHGREPAADQQPAYNPALILQHAGGAVAAGIDPGSADAKAVVDRIVPPSMAADERIRLADKMETFTDRQVERYWQLIGVINGRPPFEPNVPAFEWLITALRATA